MVLHLLVKQCHKNCAPIDQYIKYWIFTFLSMALLHVTCFENKSDLSLPFFSALKLISFPIPLNVALS
jgi:hypothetical protein